jgi:hypothetical protein
MARIEMANLRINQKSGMQTGCTPSQTHFPCGSEPFAPMVRPPRRDANRAEKPATCGPSRDSVRGRSGTFGGVGKPIRGDLVRLNARVGRL